MRAAFLRKTRKILLLFLYCAFRKSVLEQVLFYRINAIIFNTVNSPNLVWIYEHLLNKIIVVSHSRSLFEYYRNLKSIVSTVLDMPHIPMFFDVVKSGKYATCI